MRNGEKGHDKNKIQADSLENRTLRYFFTVRYKCVLAYIFPALKLRIEQLFVISIYEDFLIIL